MTKEEKAVLFAAEKWREAQRMHVLQGSDKQLGERIDREWDLARAVDRLADAQRKKGGA